MQQPSAFGCSFCSGSPHLPWFFDYRLADGCAVGSRIDAGMKLPVPDGCILMIDDPSTLPQLDVLIFLRSQCERDHICVVEGQTILALLNRTNPSRRSRWPQSKRLQGCPSTSVSGTVWPVGSSGRDLPIQREDRVRQTDRDKLLLCRGRAAGHIRDRGQHSKSQF